MVFSDKWDKYIKSSRCKLELYLNKNSGEIDGIESDFANLARLAVSGESEDIRYFLARLVRKYRRTHPDLAVELDQYLRASQARPSLVTRFVAKI